MSVPSDNAICEPLPLLSSESMYISASSDNIMRQMLEYLTNESIRSRYPSSPL
jgi:hypothetical protein